MNRITRRNIFSCQIMSYSRKIKTGDRGQGGRVEEIFGRTTLDFVGLSLLSLLFNHLEIPRPKANSQNPFKFAFFPWSLLETPCSMFSIQNTPGNFMSSTLLCFPSFFFFWIAVTHTINKVYCIIKYKKLFLWKHFLSVDDNCMQLLNFQFCSRH